MKFKSPRDKERWEKAEFPLKEQTEGVANDLEAEINKKNLDIISWELYQQVHRKYFPDFGAIDFFMVSISLAEYWLYANYRDTTAFPHFPQDFDSQCNFKPGILTQGL